MIATMEQIVEFVDNRGVSMRVDRQANVIRGVKILGLVSRNGRQYREAAVRRAVGLYEGRPCNVDHPQQPGQSRSYRDRIGNFSNVRFVEGSGIYADLRYNPKHSIAEQLIWDAENRPTNLGLSHNIKARTLYERGAQVVEAIEEVRSVDLVADPATTSGLFEGAGAGTIDEETRSLKARIAVLEAEAQARKQSVAESQSAGFDAEDFRRRLYDDSPSPPSWARRNAAGSSRRKPPIQEQQQPYDSKAIRRELGIKSAKQPFDEESFRRELGIVN